MTCEWFSRSFKSPFWTPVEKANLCIRFCNEVRSFVIILINLRCTEIFFAIFWKYERRPKSAIKSAKNRFGQSSWLALQDLRCKFCCFCEVILSRRWPNKYYFDNIAILATIGRILSEKVKKTDIFSIFSNFKGL